MNLTILPFRFNQISNITPSNNNSAITAQTSYLPSLKQDIVSFGVGAKKKEEGPLSISHDLAMLVVTEAKEDSIELLHVLNKHLKHLVASTKHPNNPICAGSRGIRVRVKEEESLRDKVTPRGITTKWGVKNVGDLIGARIVLRDASPKAVDKVLKSLADAVKQGDLRVVEIEKYNPRSSAKYKVDPRDAGYGSSEGLKYLENAAGLEARVGPQPSGYPAIHVTIKTKHGYKAEIQIMGVEVEDLKDVEDLGYKIRCGKGIPLEYKSLEPAYVRAYERIEENGLDDAYMDYVNDSYLHAFNAPVQKFNSKKKQEFLKIPYYLPQELDFTEMAKDMERCKLNKTKLKKTIVSSPSQKTKPSSDKK